MINAAPPKEKEASWLYDVLLIVVLLVGRLFPLDRQ